MTALEYMEKQYNKHKANYIRESDRNAPKKMLDDIQLKIGYYSQAIDALKQITL